jgi:Spy/CpxP family protein refolding chaperone
MKPSWSTIAPAFILGLALGAAAGSWGQRAAFHRMMSGASTPNRHRMILDRMSRELGLDEKQRETVSAVMDSRKADIDKLKTDTFARLEAIRKSADAEMAKALAPQQAAKLEAMHRAKPLRINWEASPAVPSAP